MQMDICTYGLNFYIHMYRLCRGPYMPGYTPVGTVNLPRPGRSP